METVFSQWEKVHREILAFIAGMGLQCECFFLLYQNLIGLVIHKPWIWIQELQKYFVDKILYFHGSINLEISTLDLELEVAPGVNIAHGLFGKNIKRSPKKGIPHTIK